MIKYLTEEQMKTMSKDDLKKHLDNLTKDCANELEERVKKDGIVSQFIICSTCKALKYCKHNTRFKYQENKNIFDTIECNFLETKE